MKKSKLLCLLLVVIMIVGLIPITANAATTTYKGNIVKSSSSNTITYGSDATIITYITPGAGTVELSYKGKNDKYQVFKIVPDDGWAFVGWLTYYKGMINDGENFEYGLDGTNYFSDENAPTAFRYPYSETIRINKELTASGTYYLYAIFQPTVTVKTDGNVAFTLYFDDRTLTSDLSTYVHGLKYNYSQVKVGYVVTDDNHIANTVNVTGTSDYDPKETDYLTGTDPQLEFNNITGPITINITTKIKTFNFAFDGNGADSGSMTTQTFSLGAAQKLVANAFAKKGYDFTGWNTAKDGSGTAYKNEQLVTIMPTEDGTTYTLYAQWTPAALDGTVNITGKEKVGEALTATVSDSNNTGVLSYQWQRNGVDINSETSEAYTITTADINSTLTCVVTSSVQTGYIMDTTGTIAKVDAAYMAPFAINLTYNGEAQELVTAGLTKDGTMMYSLEESGEYTSAVPIAKNAGTYTVYYYVKGDSNHNNTAVSSVDVTIAKEELTVTANDNIITYGDAPTNNSVTYNGFVNNETESVLSGTLDFDYNYSQYGNAGSDYTITPKGLTSDNYDIKFVNGKLTVEQKEIGIEWSNLEFTYDGNSQVPTATVTKVVNNDNISLTVSGAQTNVGEYTASVTTFIGDKVGNYKLPTSDLTTRFKINNAEQTTPTGLGAGNETISNKKDGKITGVNDLMEYRAEGEKDYTPVPDGATGITDLAAGTYYVRYKAKDNHNASAAIPLVIATGDKLTVTFVVDDKILTTVQVDYGADAEMPEIPVKDGYTFSGWNTEPDGSGIAYADGQSLTFTQATDGTEETLYAQWTLIKTDATYTAPTANDLTYNGQAQELITSGSTDDGTLMYSLNENEGYTTTIPTATNADTYTVYYYVKGDDTHNDSAVQSVDVAIKQKELTVTANDNTITYGDAPTNDGVTYSGYVNDETESVLSGTLDFDYNYTKYSNVGSDYTITPKGLTSDNYDVKFVSGKLTVEQKEIGIEWSNLEFTYDGNAQAPTATATKVVNNDNISLTVSGAQTNVGQYTAEVTEITGDKASNYRLPNCGLTTTFKINNAEQTAPTGLGAGNETISNKKDGKITGVNDLMEYRAEGENDYTPVPDGATEITNLAAGTYYVRYKAKDNQNASAANPVVIATGDKLTVTFVVDGKILTTVQVDYAADTEIPEIPAKDGYTSAWDKDGKAITENTTITAVYKRSSVTENTEQVKDITPDDVTPENKDDFEKAEEDLEKAPKENDGIYTEEEKADNPADTTSPDTGDNSNLAFWFALAIFSLSALVGLTIYDKSKRTRG